MSSSVPRGLVTAIISCSLDGILAVDSERRVLLWNPVIERMFGIPRDQVVGRRLEEVAPFLLAAEGEKILEAALAGSAIRGREHSYAAANTGEEGWYQAHYFPVRTEDQVVAALVVIRDLTEAKWTLYSLRKAQERESELLSELGRFRQSPPEARAVASPPAGPSSTREASPPVETTPVSPSPQASSPPDPMVFDRKAALGYLGGDEPLLSEMAEIFANTWPDLSVSIDQAVNGRDAKHILFYAQKLKGMVAALGGHRSTWACSELENLARDGKTGEADKIWGRLKGEVARLLKALAPFVRPRAA